MSVCDEEDHDPGVDDNTIVLFTTDNGTEVFTARWSNTLRTIQEQSEGGFRVPALLRWPAKCRRTCAERDFLRSDWLPTP